MNSQQAQESSNGFLKLLLPQAGLRSAALYRIQDQAFQLVCSEGSLPISSWREAISKHQHLLVEDWCVSTIDDNLFCSNLNSGRPLSEAVQANAVIIPIKRSDQTEILYGSILDELEGVLLLVDSNPIRVHEEFKSTIRSAKQVARQILLANAFSTANEGRQELPSVVENAPAIVFELMARPNGRYEFRYISPAISQIPDLTPDSIIANAKTLFRRIADDDRDELFNSLDESARTLEEWHWEGRVLSQQKDSEEEEVWIKGIGRPLRRIDRSTIWDGVFIDITRNKNTEFASQQAIQALEKQVNDRSVELLKSQQEVLQRLIEAVSCSHGETGDHIMRMSQYAVEIARELGWSDAQLDMLLQASPLHDIGKIGIPPSLLSKPETLTSDERKVVQDHCQLGAKILQGGSSPLVQMAEEIALCHHERWDGKGYPYGLKGDKIPMSARIVAVADVLDALTCTRAYKRAWKLQDSLEEIVSCAGTQFDPDVVDALVMALPRIQEIHDALAVKDESSPKAA